MKDLIDQFQMLDIPRRESEVYLALLQKREFTAPEIAKITTVSRTKAYEVLQNLVKKGLCNESYRNGTKVFKAINPKIVLDNLSSEYDKKRKTLEELNKSLEEIYRNTKTFNDPLEYIEVLTEIGQIKERWLMIQENAKTEELVFNKGPYSIPPEDNIEYENELLVRNVVCKGLYEYDNSMDESSKVNFISMMEHYSRMGEEVRVINKLPMKLAIIDQRVTMLALNDPVSLTPSITTMIITHPSFAIAQKEVFNSYWQKAESLENFIKKNLPAELNK